jgi:guanidinobutyrase
MAEVRQQMGDGPVYLSFDIDSLDPSGRPVPARRKLAA